MLGTGGDLTRVPPSPARAAVIEMFGESHAFNGVAGRVESGLFAPSNSTSTLQKSGAEDAAAGALLCLQGAGDKEESSRAQQGEQGPPKKKQRTEDSCSKETILQLQQRVLKKELETLQKLDSVLNKAAEFSAWPQSTWSRE